jgi:glycosyltransferase involved in cell wall biosynthesis
MKNSKDLISIIIPVYKVEKYLRRCVESILVQTYSNFEIILIDDDSPDFCPQICDQYSKQYTNIQVIHLKDSGIGVSDVRNAGLDFARGNYITFIDSDDYVHKDLLKILKEALDNHPTSGMSMSSYQKVTENTIKYEELTDMQATSLNAFEAINLLVDDQNKSALWSKLFKREIFDELRFPKDKHNEDMFVMPFILQKAKQIVFVPQSIYYYFQDNESLCRSEFNYNKLDMVEALTIWKKYISIHHSGLIVKFNSHFFSTLLNFCQYLALTKDVFGAQKFKYYETILINNFYEIIKSRFISKNNKIKIVLLRLNCFKFYFKLVNFFGIRSYK